MNPENTKSRRIGLSTISDGLGKLPPQAIELEESVLGAILLEKGALDNVIDILYPDSFYKDSHKEIYTAIIDLFNDSQPIDIKTVSHQLRKVGKLELVGGAHYISGLTAKVNSAANIEYHARIVAEQAIKRDLIKVSSETQRDAYEDTIDVFKLLDKTEQSMFNISERGVKKNYEKASNLLRIAIDEIQEKEGNDGITGVPSGFYSLDKITAGWQKTDLIIIAARPGMGKCLGANEIVKTPEGNVEIGDILEGDLVCDTKGGYCRVQGVYPQGKKEMYEITFDDGLIVKADGDHLWEVKDRKTRKRGRNDTRVLTTKEILSEGIYVGGGKRKNFSIKYPKPVLHTKKTLLIDPYILGLMIGDGGLSQTSIYFHNTEEDLIGCVKNYFGHKNVVQVSNKEYRINNSSEFKHSLDKYSLLGKRSWEKFIPDDFLYSSIQDRSELLRGLLDTDGHIVTGNESRIEYSTSSVRLKSDIITLVRGLGGRASFTKRMGRYSKKGKTKETRINYRIWVSFPSTGISPVSSKKHLLKYIQKTQFHQRFITDIKNTNKKEEAVCIKVDSPDECFLMNDYLVTHNTAFIISALRNAAIDFKTPVAMFSLEMSSTQLMNRLISSEAEIESNKIKRGTLQSYEWEQITHKTDGLSKAPIFIDDTPSLSILELRAKSRRLVSQHGVKLIVVDYLQLMTGDKTGNREQEISSIARSLKAIAKDLNVPVIALSQLSRAVETRGGDKIPMLSDLRESGCISGEALVQKPEGLSSIGDLDGDENFDIFGYNPNNSISKEKANKCWRTGKKRIMELTLTTGHSIRATKNHKFLTNEGWKRLDEISDDDYVAIPINYNSNRSDYNENISYLMGALIANGKVHKRQPITYTCNTKDSDLAEIVKSISEENFECSSRIVDNRPKYNWINTYIKSKKPVSRKHRNPLVKFFDNEGIYDKRAAQKHLPEKIFGQKKDVILNMLAGLYDNDGSIHLIKNKSRTTPSISYSSSSARLISEIRLLLQMVGVVSRSKKLEKDGHTWYNLSISGKENVILFCSQVPLRSSRKNEQVKQIMDHLKTIRGGWLKHYKNEKRSLAFIQIKSITKINGRFDVYDIEVPKTHNFTVNGILAHNSIEQDADMVMFLYRPEYYGLDTDESGAPTTGQGMVIIAKNRNGETDSVWMRFIGKYIKWLDSLEEPVVADNGSSFPVDSADSKEKGTDFTITLPPKNQEDKTDDLPF